MEAITKTTQVGQIPNLETNNENSITVTSEAKSLKLAQSDRSLPVSVSVGSLDLRLKADGTYKVVARKDVQTQAITIPSEYNNAPVTEIAITAFAADKNLTAITIPSTVTYIGANAFAKCSNLNSVSFFLDDGDDLQIGATAFMDCTSLSSVGFPKRLTTIGNGAFKGCTNLTQIYHEDVADNRLVSIGESAFMDCTSLERISLDVGVKEIGRYAFSGCSALDSNYYDIPRTCTKIGMGAFKNCYKMTAFTLPESLTFIGVNAFLNDPIPAESNYKRSIKFADPYTWFTSINETPEYSDLTLQHPTTLFDANSTDMVNATNLKNGRKLSLNSSGNLGGFCWHKFKQMPTPEISIENGILNMTDPLGVAEEFHIYVGKSYSITIQVLEDQQ